MILPKGNIYKVNSTGPSTEPCGTLWLAVTTKEESVWFSPATVLHLFLKAEGVHHGQAVVSNMSPQ